MSYFVLRNVYSVHQPCRMDASVISIARTKSRQPEPPRHATPNHTLSTFFLRVCRDNPATFACAALYKGDERTRTLDVRVDGVMVTTWTSSGATLDFENTIEDVFELGSVGVKGQVVELTGVIADSEWLSITEVCAVAWWRIRAWFDRALGDLSDTT